MGLNLKDVSTGGGGWFKPEEHVDDVAILIEVKKFDRQRPSDYGPRDSIVVDATYFATIEELNSGTPSSVAKSMRIEQTILCRDLNDDIGVGNATIVQLGQAKSKKGQHPAWVWRSPSNDVKVKVAAYAEKRDAELQAALASAPEFDG